MIFFWIFIFILSLIALVKGADLLIEKAEKISLATGLSPFIVGIIIVGQGTSFPELFFSLLSTLRGLNEVAIANAIGSNIVNILLIIGLSAILAKKLVVRRNLIDLDLPLLAASTGLILGILWDKKVTFNESLLLIISYLIYFFYTLIHKEETPEIFEVLPSRRERRKKIGPKEEIIRPKFEIKDFFLLILGFLFLYFGTEYLIKSLVNLSLFLKITTGVISLTAVAFGTSLPELITSVEAAYRKKTEIALGNIFGSNVFNSLMVIGLPGLFSTLFVDDKTFFVGLPTLVLTTILFVISGISRQIHIWEGSFYLLIYLLFLGKIFNFL
jgi:cation:H+ antiporter